MDEYAHFSFNKCPIYTQDGASAKFSTNSLETDNSAELSISSAKKAVILIVPTVSVQYGTVPRRLYFPALQ